MDNHMCSNFTWRIKRSVFLRSCFLIYAGIAFIVFLNSTYPVLMGEIESTVNHQAPEGVGLWDATTYYKYAETVRTDGTQILLDIFKARVFNLLPPILLLLLLQNNPIFVFCFNILILYISLFSLLKYYAADVQHKIFFLTLLNPFIFYCIMAINKEITSIASILFLAAYIVSNRKKYIFLSLLFAFFARFHLLIIVFVFLLVKHMINNRKRLIVLLGYIGGLTILVPWLGLFTNIVKKLYSSSNTGIMVVLNELSEEYYLFFLVFIPKILANFFGDLFKITSKSLSDPIVYSELLFLFIVFLSILKRKYYLQSDSYFLMLLYVILMRISPIVHHRYFLPIYPLLVIIYTQKRLEMKGVFSQ